MQQSQFRWQRGGSLCGKKKTRQKPGQVFSSGGIEREESKTPDANCHETALV
jgi:hypothetical protein